MNKRSLPILFMVLGIFLLNVTPCHAKAWKEDFDRLCGYVAEAESLPTDELKKISVECDSLLETLQALDAPEKKVYIFRLEKCKKFFQYILELRDNEASATPSEQ
jgi:hypothetical protein